MNPARRPDSIISPDRLAVVGNSAQTSPLFVVILANPPTALHWSSPSNRYNSLLGKALLKPKRLACRLP